MDNYLDGSEVKLILPFINSMGDQVTPTALRYKVVDEAYEDVLAWTVISTFDANLGSVEITLGAGVNTLAADYTAGYRRVDLEITVNSSVWVTSSEYILKKTAQLVVGKNSFQTYEQAVLNSFEMGELKGWDAANKTSRVAALARAYDSISSFGYQFNLASGEVLMGDPRSLTLAQWQGVEERQRKDFLKAQIAQADFALGGNPTEKDIGDGLQSSTIGEVSQFYRPRPSLTTALSRAALYYVGRYIYWNVNIGRA